MKNRILLLILVLLTSGLTLFAEEKKPEAADQEKPLVYQVVVTPSRSPQSSKELGTSVTILPGRTFGGAIGTEMLSRLGSVPGLSFTQNGGFGQAAGISIRGANAEHTLVLIDGIEVNDPSSPSRSFDFGSLDMNDVERIEVVRGAQSPLYGSDSLGGVVQIITRGAPQKGVAFDLGAEVGRYQTFRERASLSGRSRKASFNLSLSRIDSRGFSAASESYGNTEEDGIAQNLLNFKGDLSLTDRLSIGVNARYSQADVDMDNGAGLGSDDPNYTADNRHLLLAFRGSWQTLPGSWKQSLTLSVQRTERLYDNPIDDLHPDDASQGAYLANNRKLSWQNEIRLSEHLDLVGGLEWQQETAESTYTYTNLWGPDESIFPKASAATLSAYAALNLDLGDRLFVSTGLRYDRHDQFGGQVSVKFSPAFFITSSTKLMGSVSTGFKAPSLYQLFAPATLWGPIGNTALEPESALTLDLGLQQTLWQDRIVLEVTAFFNQFRNLIDYDWTAGYINVLKAKSRGFEASLLLRPHNRMQVNAAYTYLDTEDEATELPLLRRPRHRFNLGASWMMLETLSLSADLRHVGSRPDVYPYPERISSEAYSLVSAGLEWSGLRGLKLYLRVENLGDRVYEPVVGYGSARRSATVGAQWTF